MNNKPLDISAFYHTLISTYGIYSPRALSWGRARTQLLRFQKLYEVGELHEVTVLDVGCGVGDLYDFLLHQGCSSLSYTGVDLLDEMIEGAKKKYPGIDVFQHDFANDLEKSYDYVLSSGAFSFHIPQAKEVYFEMIKRLYTHAKKGVAFNILDRKHHPIDEAYYAYDIDEVVEFCQSFAAEVKCIRGYLDWDATIYMYRARTST